MKTRIASIVLALGLLAGAVRSAVVIETVPGASSLERLSAMEVQRYVYLRTGDLPVVARSADDSHRIVVARQDRAVAARSGIKALGPEQYEIKTTGKTWWIVGGDDIGTLYGAYRFAEKLGVRFYLHGDVIPDDRLKSLPTINEDGRPLFSIRGIQPFHDFPEGPDWWNTDDYLAYIAQLPKMRMNFIGLHCYPEGGAGPEPSVWIGLADDADGRGRVRFSYPSHWANTKRQGAWGYAAMSTSDFTGGASLLFPGDDYGPDVMGDALPRPATPEQSNAVFDRTAEMLRTAFSTARALGVKTCVGTETPLAIPGTVRERLKEQGRDPADPAVVREVYRVMFQRIARACPVDYYWLWTPEQWTWAGNTEEDLRATMGDIRAALSALDSLGNPCVLATCGWVLGPSQDRTALDAVLPKGSPMSCINRSVGHAPVDPSFAGIEGRPKWAIPWMENDPALASPQPWVGRMRYDAADALRLGCTGLLGIHWRTKAMAQNVSALADAAWDQSWASDDFARALREIDEQRDGPIGGSVVTYPAPVENTDDDPVYQSVRYDVDGYRLKVPNGTYAVTLKFNEPHYNDPGKRVFGVKLQGQIVIDRLDMVAEWGRNVAHDFTYPDIRVADGRLNVDFIRLFELPCIAGIVIEGRTDSGALLSRKINCGGPKYRDYEADNVPSSLDLDRRGMPVEDFYLDFARASFGANVAGRIGRILAEVDGRGMPEATGWIGGPGAVQVNGTSWDEERKRYAFVDDMAALRPSVRGAGNLERFDYWLNTYRCAAAMAELGCLRGKLDAIAAAVNAEQDSAKRKAAAEKALDVRIRMARRWERMMTYQLAAVDTPGEMGTVANLEQHSRGTLKFLTAHDELLAQALGSALPGEVEPSKVYTGPARIIVPTVRTQVSRGESLRLRVIILDKNLPRTVSLHWRPLGSGDLRKVDLRDIGRATYEAQLPPADGSFEYYVTAETAEGRTLGWPASAPRTCQTVVVWDMPRGF
ncbi:MAG: hypothetical protein KBC96_07285 [Armatimonadetes bacterium]|nr:hypothetical protein [Armatimonadota bacterium]